MTPDWTAHTPVNDIGPDTVLDFTQSHVAHNPLLRSFPRNVEARSSSIGVHIASAPTMSPSRARHMGTGPQPVANSGPVSGIATWDSSTAAAHVLPAIPDGGQQSALPAPVTPGITNNETVTHSDSRRARTDIDMQREGDGGSVNISNANHVSSPRPIKLSLRSAQYLGKQIPRNTSRNNSNSIRALCRFVVERFGTGVSTEATPNEIETGARVFLFPNGSGGHMPHGTEEFSMALMIQLRDVLIEFATSYRNTRTGEDLKASTLKNYVTNIQRAFKNDWGYDINLLSGPVFDCPRAGLVSVLDNKVRELQRNGDMVLSHNVLSKEEVVKLYKSPSLSRDTSAGFQARMVFTIGLLTGMRPTALWTLSVSQIRRQMFMNKQCYVITGAVGSSSGSSKTTRGGWRAIGQKPQEVVVWDETYHGSINFFQDIDLYLRLRDDLDSGTDRFFLAINHHAASQHQFFKRSAIGKNHFSKIVKDVCKREKIVGSGTRNWVTTHSLRGTLATILFGAGHSDSSVAMRTGHRDPRSLKSYQNLRGTKGREQQRDLLREPPHLCRAAERTSCAQPGSCPSGTELCLSLAPWQDRRVW